MMISKDIIKTSDTLFILFHGTGGSEDDLIPIAEHLDNEASVIALRGEVMENNSRRFFKRIAPNVYDLEDLELQTIKIEKFLEEQLKLNKYKRVIGLGYSNGANILTSLIFKNSNIFTDAILMHPYFPVDIEEIDLKGINIFISASENDRIVPYENTLELKKKFEISNAHLTTKTYFSDHSISPLEIQDIKDWL